jgi:hypothetical protein
MPEPPNRATVAHIAALSGDVRSVFQRDDEHADGDQNWFDVAADDDPLTWEQVQNLAEEDGWRLVRLYTPEAVDELLTRLPTGMREQVLLGAVAALRADRAAAEGRPS